MLIITVTVLELLLLFSLSRGWGFILFCFRSRISTCNACSIFLYKGDPVLFRGVDYRVSKFFASKAHAVVSRDFPAKNTVRYAFIQNVTVFLRILMTREKFEWPKLHPPSLILSIKCALLFSGAFLWLYLSSDQCCFRWAKYCKCSPVSTSITDLK